VLLAAYANASQNDIFRSSDDKSNRPLFTFGAEYNRFASFKNYSTYYTNFQNDKLGIGISDYCGLCLTQAGQPKRRQSAAIAARAQAQADQASNQVSEQVLQIEEKSLAELAAQKRVAQLQRELAQKH